MSHIYSQCRADINEKAFLSESVPLISVSAGYALVWHNLGEQSSKERSPQVCVSTAHQQPKHRRVSDTLLDTYPKLNTAWVL